MTLSPKKRIAIFVTFIALFVFLIPIIFLNVTGYRFNKENILVPTGGIYIHPWNVSGIITLDDKPVDDNGIFGIGKNYFFQNLSEGKTATSPCKTNPLSGFLITLENPFEKYLFFSSMVSDIFSIKPLSIYFLEF